MKKIIMIPICLLFISISLLSCTADLPYKTLVKGGWRVSWSRTLNLIALDKNDIDGYPDVYTVLPDGSALSCLTCDKQGIPQLNNGNPEWYPTGEYIIFQAQDPSPPKVANNPRWTFRMIFLQKALGNPGIGVNNNLWLMSADGSKFWQLTHVFDGQGVLHPHFSQDGKRLVWSEMFSFQDSHQLGNWVIKIAGFSIDNGQPQLTNIQTLKPKDLQLYETHEFSSDGSKILFSGIPKDKGGGFYDMEIYQMDLSTKQVSQLTDNNEWDEHAHFNADGSRIVWLSSTDIPQPKGNTLQDALRNPPKLDYWIMNADGTDKHRLTGFNDPNAPEYISGGIGFGDWDWSPDGKTMLASMRGSSRSSVSDVLLDLDNL